MLCAYFQFNYVLCAYFQFNSYNLVYFLSLFELKPHIFGPIIIYIVNTINFLYKISKCQISQVITSLNHNLFIVLYIFLSIQNLFDS